MLGYTGTYQGKPVSVQTTGMGTPSTSIIVEELPKAAAEVILPKGTVSRGMLLMHPRG